MTTRRAVLKGSLALAATGGVLLHRPPAIWAAGDDFPPGVLYTAANPGQWARKVASHAPVVSRKGNRITITTNHGMSAAHYIVRHTLVCADGTVVGATTFQPGDSKAVSTYTVSGECIPAYATSFCNLHDLWLTAL